MSVTVLSISLDRQIAAGGAFGDTVARQQHYAAGLRALHVVVKTGPELPRRPVRLAPNAWAYPTGSRSRYCFPFDAYHLAVGLCRREAVDVVSAQDPFATGLVAYLVARRFGVPLNVQVHFDVLDNPYWLRERLEHRVLNALGRWLVRRADTVRVGTTRERDKLLGWGLPPERIYVAPVPVAVRHFAAAEPDPLLSELRPPGGAIVLAPHRLVPQKDLATLLRAAAAVVRARPETRFVLAGDGPQRPWLERLAHDLGLGSAVAFIGAVDHGRMPGLMAAADVVAISSVYEGTSLVAVEALASGTPVVTTDVAGAPDTVQDGISGRVVPVGDAGALAAALLDLLADPARARTMGEAGRRHVLERFDHQRAVQGVLAMWRETADGRRTTDGGRRTEDGGRRRESGGRRADEGWKGRELVYLANARIPSEKAHVYQIMQMVDALGRQGIEVELVYPARANLARLAGHDPVAHYGLRTRPRLSRVPVIDLVRLVTIDRPALNRPPWPRLAYTLESATFALAAAARARRASGVIYSRDWPVLAAAALLRPRAPLFWEAHDLPQHPGARQALRRLLPRLAGIIAISHGLAAELEQRGAAPERLLVAPDAVDLERFAALPTKAEARRRLGLPPDEAIVVYAGHLYPWKGAHTLALASRRLPPAAAVYIVGGTPADLQAFRRFVARERLDRVRVAGYVPPATVPLWLAAADVLALPNSGREIISARYTSPLKLFEYMAAGRPIVASDLPSIRELLRHGENAYLVPADDPQALAGGLQAVLSDPQLGERLAAAARRAVEGHTWDARAEAIVAFIHGRLAPGQGRRELAVRASAPLSENGSEGQC